MGLLDFLKTNVNNSRVDLSKRSHPARGRLGTMSKFYAAKDLRTGRMVGLKILDRERTKAFEDRFRGLKSPPKARSAWPSSTRCWSKRWNTARPPTAPLRRSGVH